MALVATVLATLCSYFLPESFAATGVGFSFLACAYWLVIKEDDGTRARHFGISLAGLFESEPLKLTRIVGATLKALREALSVAAIVFPLFWLGFVWWWNPQASFQVRGFPNFWDQILGQILVIALPEEVFYRGYLQTALDDALPRRIRVLNVDVGCGLVLASAMFALGHLFTEVNPSRLAVFFPALLFGWLRLRTGSVAAPVLLHAMSNLFASFLGRGYGLFE